MIIINITDKTIRKIYLSMPLTPFVIPPLLFLHTPFPIISGPCSAVCFSLLSWRDASNSVSFSLSHSTVRLSTVSWFGCSLPLVSSTKLSSKLKVIGVEGGDLKLDYIVKYMNYNIASFHDIFAYWEYIEKVVSYSFLLFSVDFVTYAGMRRSPHTI